MRARRSSPWSCCGSCGCSRPGSCWSGRGPDKETGERPSWRHTTVLGWAGMRGVVTLAAAFAIPESLRHRETLILIALVVAAGTLFIQGSTLPWLVRRLRLPAPDPREDALARAALFEKATAAGVERLDETPATRTRSAPGGAAPALGSGTPPPGSGSAAPTPTTRRPSEAYARLRLEMLGAEREKVLKMRSTGTIPHEVVEDVLVALDVEESMLDVRNERLAELEGARDRERRHRHDGAACEHLDARRATSTPSSRASARTASRRG